MPVSPAAGDRSASEGLRDAEHERGEQGERNEFGGVLDEQADHGVLLCWTQYVLVFFQTQEAWTAVIARSEATTRPSRRGRCPAWQVWVASSLRSSQ